MTQQFDVHIFISKTTNTSPFIYYIKCKKDCIAKLLNSRTQENKYLSKPIFYLQLTIFRL